MNNNIMLQAIVNMIYRKQDKTVAKKVRAVLNVDKRDKKATRKQREISHELVEYFKNKKYDKKDKRFLVSRLKKLLKLELKDIQPLERRKIKLALKNLDNIDFQDLRSFKQDFEQDYEENQGYEIERKIFGIYRDDNGKVEINKTVIEEGLASENPKDRMETIMEIIETVIHEAMHCKQRIMMRSGVCTREILKLTKGFFFSDTYRAGYWSNYNQIGYEHNAESKALKKQRELFEGLDDEESKLYKEFLQKELELQEIVPQFYWLDKPKSEEEYKYLGVYRMEFMEDITIGQVIKEEPWIITSRAYPMLSRMYDDNGGRYFPRELLWQLEIEKDFIEQNQYLSDKEKEEAIRQTEETYSELMWNVLSVSNSQNIFNDLEDDEKEDVKRLLMKAKELIASDREEVKKKSSEISEAYEKNSSTKKDPETVATMDKLIVRKNYGEQSFLSQSEEKEELIDEFIEEL